MRLAAGMDLDLDARVAPPISSTSCAELRLVGAGEQRQELAAAVEQTARRRRPRPRRSSRPLATAVPSTRPSHAPLRTSTPSRTTSREAMVTSPVATPSIALRHRRLVLGRGTLGVVGDHRGQPRLHGPRRHDAQRLVREPRRLLGGEDHVRVVRQHDHLRGGRRVDCSDDLLRRGVHRLPALDHAGRPEALEEAPVARPRARRRRHPSRASAAPRAPRPRGAPRAPASAGACSRSRRRRSSRRRARGAAPRPGRRCGRAPSARVGSPTTRSESPSCSSSASSASASSPVPSTTKTVQ